MKQAGSSHWSWVLMLQTFKQIEWLALNLEIIPTGTAGQCWLSMDAPPGFQCTFWSSIYSLDLLLGCLCLGLPAWVSAKACLTLGSYDCMCCLCFSVCPASSSWVQRLRWRLGVGATWRVICPLLGLPLSPVSAPPTVLPGHISSSASFWVSPLEAPTATSNWPTNTFFPNK